MVNGADRDPTDHGNRWPQVQTHLQSFSRLCKRCGGNAMAIGSRGSVVREESCEVAEEKSYTFPKRGAAEVLLPAKLFHLISRL